MSDSSAPASSEARVDDETPAQRLLRAARKRLQRPSEERLRDAAITAGAFACSTLALSLACRIALLVIAARADYLSEPRFAHVAWLAPSVAYDAMLALGTFLLVAGVRLLLPVRLKAVAPVLGYAWLLTIAAIFTVSLPLYGALQVTLHWNQLRLAGGLRDLIESGLGVVSAWAIACAALLALAGAFAVPAIARRLSRVPRRVLRGVAVAAVVLPVGALLPMPVADVAGLERNAAYDFVGSVVREALPEGHARDKPDMRGAPHFDSAPMFDRVQPEPTPTLVDEKRLPLEHGNVVLVVLESASVHHVGLWGGKPKTVPRLTALADRALLFDGYYASTPVSMKSLMSIACSTYTQPHPVADTYDHPKIDCMSLSEVLEKEGYRAGLFHGGRFAYTRKDRFFRGRGYSALRDAETLEHRNNYKKVPWGVDDRAVVDDALAWLDKGVRKHPKQPFLVTLVFLAPHHPYKLNRDIPTPFGTKSTLQRYRNATAFIDSQIGRVWDWLVANGRDRDTLLVIAGDHGEAFGEHRGQHGHGHGIYEEAMRTPLMLVNERLFHGARTDRVGNHLDLVPTILDVLGLPRPQRHQGQSLLRGYEPRTIYFYADWHGHYLGLRDGRWKYIHDVDRKRHELYDLRRDPRERHNRITEMKREAKAYAKRVLAWERFYDELMPNYDRYVDGTPCEGRTVCYLDELKPIRTHGRLKVKRSISGDPLFVGNERYKRGFGVAPLSVLAFRVEGAGFTRLRGGAGHHAFGGQANLSLQVAAQIYVDHELVWSSGKLTADEPAKRFDIALEDAKQIELIGHDVDGEHWRDYLDWVDVRLER
jgi:arylsulfatase A-like enzyme